MRYRKCLTTDPNASECQGNEREIRECLPPMSNGNSINSTNSIDPIPNPITRSIIPETVQKAGVSNLSIFLTFFFLILLAGSNFFIYMYMKKRTLPRDIKSIGSPCFDSFPNQYSSLPTKEERPKVKRHSSFSSTMTNAGVGTNAKILANGTLTKSNNVTGHQTPKVLSKSFVEIDTATIKRNSHALNNARSIRATDEDKF